MKNEEIERVTNANEETKIWIVYRRLNDENERKLEFVPIEFPMQMFLHQDEFVNKEFSDEMINFVLLINDFWFVSFLIQSNKFDFHRHWWINLLDPFFKKKNCNCIFREKIFGEQTFLLNERDFGRVGNLSMIIFVVE